MSDILIKDMEMPKGCYFCQFVGLALNDECFFTREKMSIQYLEKHMMDKRSRHCPLVDIGEYGDLIDKHRLLEKLRELINEVGVLDGETDTRRVLKLVEESPTILPSNGSVQREGDEEMTSTVEWITDRQPEERKKYYLVSIKGETHPAMWMGDGWMVYMTFTTDNLVWAEMPKYRPPYGSVQKETEK